MSACVQLAGTLTCVPAGRICCCNGFVSNPADGMMPPGGAAATDALTGGGGAEEKLVIRFFSGAASHGGGFHHAPLSQMRKGSVRQDLKLSPWAKANVLQR